MTQAHGGLRQSPQTLKKDVVMYGTLDKNEKL
jgi:hypothetical protein